MKNGKKIALTILGIIMLLPGLCSLGFMFFSDIGGLEIVYTLTFIIGVVGIVLLRYVKNKSE